MKKLLAPITLLLLVACQPSELDRCIEANMPEPNENERKDIIDEILYSYEIVFPDETSKQYFEALQIAEGWYVPTLGWLFEWNKAINVRIEASGISEEIKIIKNLYDYNIEYYGLSDGVDLEAYFKKTATSRCNSQGIY